MISRYHLRSLGYFSDDTDRDRASRLMEAGHRLGEAVQRLEDLLNFRCQRECVASNERVAELRAAEISAGSAR